MENNPLYPFERNRYFPGKLLTAADFQGEQNYFNNKRQFLNQFLFGRGVLCGLSVFNLDDFSVMVESGVAVDHQGREIVVGSTVVKKLSTILGFTDLTTNRATLCLCYGENLTQPVQTMDKQSVGLDMEHNRVSEDYQLCLVDTETLHQSYEMESEFYTRGRLYQDDVYTMDVVMPAVVSCGSMVKLLLQVTRHVEGGRDIQLHGVLQTPSFSGPDGKKQLEIETGNIHLAVGETFVSEYWLLAQKQENNSATIIAKAENLRIIQGDQERIAPTNFTICTAIKPVAPGALVTREIGKMSLEMRQLAPGSDKIPLADFQLVRTDNSYVIEKVEDGKNYIPLPSEARLRDEYNDFYRDPADQGGGFVQMAQMAQETANAQGQKDLVYASGTCEIPLDANAKGGSIYYSGEILHGLGRGDILVEVGLQYLKHDRTIGADGRCTIFGDAELFHQEEKLPLVHATTGVKVLNDKGSFVVAIKLLEDTPIALAELTWHAIKMPRANGLDIIGEGTNRSIVAETATVSMGLGESYFFNIRFKNMEPCSLLYTLTEENSGEITRDGVYTAPGKEGIYEIKIACAETPIICTYAYAVVKKKLDQA